ncbi:MAG: cobinamide phosphate guanylyltransferase [Gammaproteobacteria bacterium MedPE]|nr:MAG: cobinamide phosphate guanylyltransferase [Gammaproteobacteria bacterium MedPE]
MKVLYFGGQKSGKSNAATAKILSLAKRKPFYVATYDNSFDDSAMQERVDKHQEVRQSQLHTIEAPTNIANQLLAGESYIIDCLSMWIFNNLALSEQDLCEQLSAIFAIDCDVVFVLNDVNHGVIPMDSQSRRFVDLSGIIGQFVASHCDEVYRVSFGIEERLK